MIKKILTLTGKAVNVFELFNLICQDYGDLTLGELARYSYKNGCWLLWGVK